MEYQQDNTPHKFSVEELEESLEVKGIHPDDVPVLERLAGAWAHQAEIGALNEDSVNSILHAKKVEATALSPSLKMAEENSELFETMKRAHARVCAEEVIIQRALKEKKTIDGTVIEERPQLSTGQDSLNS